MRSVIIDKSSTFYLQKTDTEITVSAGVLATVIISPPIPYSINNKTTLTLNPAQTVVLKLNGRNWEISSGNTEANTIPNLESGKYLTNNGIRLLWQTIVSGVSSVFGRTGAVVAANGDYTASQVTNVPAGDISAVTVQAAINELDTEKQAISQKDASGGYAGLTLFKINFKNALNTFTSFFTNANTASRTYTFPDKDGTVAMTSDLTGGTVTSVAALTLGTTGADLSSTVANSTTTPVITLNVPTASASNRGVLSSADWSTFNSKEPAITWAQGDILYGTGVNTYTKLTKDTNATRYLSNTGGSNNPAWAQVDLTNGTTGILPAAQGGNWVLLSTANAAVSSTIDFTGLDSTYKSYHVRITRVIVSADATLYMRVGTGGGPTYQSGGTDYEYANIYCFTNAGVNTANSTGASQLAIADIGIGGTDIGNFELDIYDPSQSTGWHGARWQSVGYRASPHIFRVGSGLYRSATAVTAIRFLMSTGTITSGTFELYGIL